MENKKTKLIPLFIKMFLLTFLVLLITDIVPSVLSNGVFSRKYGREFITELFAFLGIIIVLLISKNNFIFSQKKEKFIDSIKKGWAILVIGIIILLANIFTLEDIKLSTIFNLIFYCTCIGLFEEFLCRGWVQNEFLKKYNNNEKQAKISILCASLVFGSIHFTNILAGQNFLETLLQVLQATSSGFLFGAIYYKTGNIWSTVFLHGFYDFAIMLGETGDYVDCVSLSNPSLINLIYGYVSSLLIICLYSANALKVLNVTKEDKKKEKKYNIIIIVLLVIIMAPIELEGTEDYTICYRFDDYEIKGNYEIRYPNKDNYQLKYNNEEENYLNIFKSKENELKIENPSTGKIVKLNDNVYDYILVEQTNLYIIVFEEVNLTNSKVYYLAINKELINGNDEYFDNLTKELVEIVVPDIEQMGYVYIEEEELTYPIIKTDLNEIFIIRDKDNINKLIN